jgi:hypothetical protein
MPIQLLIHDALMEWLVRTSNIYYAWFRVIQADQCYIQALQSFSDYLTLSLSLQRAIQSRSAWSLKRILTGLGELLRLGRKLLGAGNLHHIQDRLDLTRRERIGRDILVIHIIGAGVEVHELELPRAIRRAVRRRRRLPGKVDARIRVQDAAGAAAEGRRHALHVDGRARVGDVGRAAHGVEAVLGRARIVARQRERHDQVAVARLRRAREVAHRERGRARGGRGGGAVVEDGLRAGGAGGGRGGEGGYGGSEAHGGGYYVDGDFDARVASEWRAKSDRLAV